MRILPSGSAGLLLELDDLDEVLHRYAVLAAADLPVTDLVPAGRTILLAAARGVELADLQRQVREACAATATVSASGEALADPGAEAPARAGEEGTVVELPVTYDGEDLPEAAAALDCSVEELVRRHQAEAWTVAFCGFSPGFGYLVGSRFPWSVPRRSSPRTRVPRGAVALAGEFSAVYPRESPGGWQLLGSTVVEVFDLRREPPGLLTPGTSVRFVETTP